MLGGELMRGGGASGINIMGTMNMNIGDTGDSLECLDIIQRLLAENCYLKSVEMRERLQKLKKTMPKFSRYHQEVKTMNESAKNPHGMVNLSRKINEVQKKAQQKLIEVKVIDLEELKEMKIVHKNENIEKFLKNSKTNFDELKKEAHG